MTLLEGRGSAAAIRLPVYVLTHTAEDGWALIARHPRCGVFEWTALAAHGVSPAAPPQCAQAAAARLLAGWGVAVHGWDTTQLGPGRTGQPGRCAGFCAVLA